MSSSHPDRRAAHVQVDQSLKAIIVPWLGELPVNSTGLASRWKHYRRSQVTRAALSVIVLQASCSGNAQQSEELLSVLSARWPGRRDQIQQVMCFVADGKASMPPVLIYGGPSTGKTAVLR